MNLSPRSAADEAADAVALVAGEETLTFAELWDRVRAMAGSLQGEGLFCCDVAPRVDLLLPVYAALALGRPFLPLPNSLTASERADRIGVFQPTLVFERRGVQVRRLDEDRLESIDDDGRPCAAVISSGSSGLLKAAVLSRAAFVASATALRRVIGQAEDDRWLLCLSPARIGGLSVLLRALLAREPVVLLERFEPAALIDQLDRHGVTLLSLVPTMLARLLGEFPRWQPPATLRGLLVGGAALAEELRREAAARGLSIYTTYGMTETAAAVCVGPPDRARLHAGSCGPPLPGYRLRIGAAGLIEIDGPSLAREMLPHGVQTSPLTDDGWLRTSDLGRLEPDGGVIVLGRADDVIVSGGEKVFPSLVEQALRSIRGVADALVFGREEAPWGAVVAALLVPVDAPLNEDLLHRELALCLSGAARPRWIRWVTALPLLADGKPDRAAAARLTP